MTDQPIKYTVIDYNSETTEAVFVFEHNGKSHRQSIKVGLADDGVTVDPEQTRTAIEMMIRQMTRVRKKPKGASVILGLTGEAHPEKEI